MILFLITLLCIASALAVPVQNSNLKIKPLKDIGSRIVGGSKAQPGQFAWQVAITFDHPDGKYFCGGSLIAPEWVLTAAHCVDGATNFDVSLGTVNLNSAEDTENTKEYIVHEDWNPDRLENDVGLIHFTKTVQLSDNINTIKLAAPGDYLEGGVPVTVSGWGITHDDDTSVSDDLNYVGLTTLTNEECLEYYPGSVSDGMVCTDGTGPKSTCSGDSGGPLVTGSGSSATHVAVVSWVSSGGCEIGYPAGFSRTAAYSDWVSQKTGI